MNPQTLAGRTRIPSTSENPDREFSVGDAKSDEGRVRKYQASQYRHHKRVSAASDELIDPVLKAAVKRELSTENLILGEDQKYAANADTECGERFNYRRRHGLPDLFQNLLSLSNGIGGGGNRPANHNVGCTSRDCVRRFDDARLIAVSSPGRANARGDGDEFGP